jgi:hypothetical protein
MTMDRSLEYEKQSEEVLYIVAGAKFATAEIFDT